MTSPKLTDILAKSNSKLSAALLRKLLRKKIDANILGQYSSRKKGQGLQFSDLREYLPGDDIKKIHWSASARTNKIQVKNYEEEKIVQITCLIDISKSMHFGRENTLFQRACEFFCQLGLLSLQSNDAIGLGLFSSDLDFYSPPKQGQKNFIYLADKLLHSRCNSNESNLAKAISTFRLKSKGQTLCFLISDFFSQEYSDEIKLIAKQHDLILVYLSTLAEENIPAAGLLRYKCAESGREFIVDSSDLNFRNFLKSNEEKRFKDMSSLCLKSGARAILSKGDVLKELANTN